MSANIQRTNEETSTFGNQQNIGMNCYSIKQPTCENLISMTVILGWVVPEIRMYDFSLPFMCNCKVALKFLFLSETFCNACLYILLLSTNKFSTF